MGKIRNERGGVTFFEFLEPRLLLSGTSYLVNSLDDVVGPDGAITLREAIQAANTNLDVEEAPAGDPVATDVIQFSPGLTSGTITLLLAELGITEDLDIQGLGADSLTINANDLSRVFNVSAGTVTISGLHITGGNGQGGGILNAGDLSITDLWIDGNHGPDAGAIYNTGTLAVVDSDVSGNTGDGPTGGAIQNTGVSAQLLVKGSLISGNTGADGAGIRNVDGDTTVINSTVSGNTATGFGGGIHAVSGTVTVIQSTIADNDGSQGGGIYVAAGTTTLDNTVVGANIAAGLGQDVKGTFAAAGDYNLIGIVDDSTGLDASNSQYGTAAAPLDPLLGPLADNGGLTQTHLPWDSSTVLEAGDNTRAVDEVAASLVNDQRGAGFDRILNTTVDIGAAEGSRTVDFTLIGPVGTFSVGETIPIVWDPAAVPMNSTISLYYDTDATVNGNEQWIIQDQPSPTNGQYDWVPPLVLPLGDYYIGGTLEAPDGTGYDSRLAGAITLAVGGTTYLVDTTNDIIAVDTFLSLREAIQAANTNLAVNEAPAGSAIFADQIAFHPSIYGGTIVMNGSEFSITEELVITGPGIANMTINGDDASRIFSVPVGVRAGIAGVTLTNGNAADDGGAIFNEGELDLAGVDITDNTAFDDGGGVYNTGTLQVTDSRIGENVTNGSADPQGGGLYNAGTATLANVNVPLNVSYDDGGGIMAASGTLDGTDLTLYQNTAFDGGGGMCVLAGTTTIDTATVSENTGFKGGGGVWVDDGTVDLTDVTLSKNTSVASPGAGGGLRLTGGDLTMTGGTVTENSAQQGGGIHRSGGTLSMDGVDVSQNLSASEGGGIYDSGGTLTFANATISGNTAGSSGGGVWKQNGVITLANMLVWANNAVGSGGGLYVNNANLTITDSDVIDNRLTGGDVYGGGVYWYAENKSMSITRSLIQDNEAIGSNRGWGGGVYADNRRASAVYITDSTISDNRLSGVSEGYGGGLFISPSYTYYNTALSVVTRSTISGNSVYGASVSRGGGIYTAGSLGANSTIRFDAINSTVSGNRAYGSTSSGGGGIWAGAPSQTNLTQTTVTLNEASYGGGIYRAAGAVRVRNSIVAGNTAEFVGADVYGAFHADSAYDLIGVIDGSTGLDDATSQYGTTAAPLSAGLGALADNGGHNYTHAPLTGSLAVDAGSNALAVDQGGGPLVNDQRGAARIQNGTVDLGAVEGENAPMFILAGPLGSISAGDWQTFSWQGANGSATSKLTIYADPDGTYDGNEHILLADADPNVLDGSWDWAAVDVPGGTYTLGAVASDWITGTDQHSRLGATTTVLYDQAYVVDDLGDTVAVDGVLTLREALVAANANVTVGDAHAGRAGAVDIITFAPGLSGGTIGLTGGELAIADDVAIQGLGEANLTVAGDDTHRIFSVATGTNAWISGLTIRDGYSLANGAGILNEGMLRIDDVTLTDNVAFDARGGGIYNSGVLTMANSTLTTNSGQGTTGQGGAVYNATASRATISDTLISENTTAADGGGVVSAGTLVLDTVTLRQNAGFDDGGGVAISYFARLTDCVLEGNLANDLGGGVYLSSGVLRVYDSVVSGNLASTGGGVYTNGGSLYVQDTNVLDNLSSGQGAGMWDGAGQMKLANVTVTGNAAGSSGGGIYDGAGSLTILGATVSNNSSSATGGGIYDSDGTLTIQNATFIGNTAGSAGGGVWKQNGSMSLADSEASGNTAVGSGGGLHVYNANLTITDSGISGNNLTGTDVYGGGVYWYGDSKSMSVTRSVIHDNEAIGSNRGLGGGVYADNRKSSAVYVTDSTISDNRLSGASEGYGGGLFISPSYTYYSTAQSVVTRSTVSGNSVYGASVSRGGGIYTAGHLGSNSTVRFDAINSTVSGNQAYGAASSGGGGIWAAAPSQTNLTQMTVTLNEAAYGGGVYQSAGAIRVRNSIVAGNTAEFVGADVYGAFHADSTYDLIGVIDGSTGLDAPSILSGTGAAPLSADLGALADNGGYTKTHALLVGSAAVDAGSNSLLLDQLGDPIQTDQRGTVRIKNGTVDMGAYEGSIAEAFVLSGPTGLITAGDPQIISWTNASITATSLLSIYADPNGIIDGDEYYLLTDANPNVLGGEWTWYAVDVPAGTYTLGAAVVDTITATALTDRLASTVTVGYAGVYVVNDLGDAIALDGVLTLREAVTAASTNAAAGDGHAGRSVGVDIIRFDPTLSGGQINMASGQFEITDDLCIQGMAGGLLTIASDGTDRIFSIDAGVQAWIGLDWTGGMTLLGGFTTADGGAIYSKGALSLTDITFNYNTAYDDGGAIASLGTLTGTGLAFTGNSVAGSSFGPSGGAVYNAGVMTLTNSSFDTNTATEDGGAIYVAVGAEADLAGLTLLNNSAEDGGGIYSAGLLSLIGSTLTDSAAADLGGGICIAAGAASLYTNVISGGLAATGAGLYSAGGSLYAEDTTFSGNSATGHGGGIYDGGGVVRLDTVDLSNNSAGSSGGGIYDGDGALIITDGTIDDNDSGATGGGIYDSDGTLTIQNATFIGNTAGSAGGGVWKQNGSMSLADSEASGNTAVGSGGGLHVYNANLTITDSGISGNNLTGTDVYGGGVHWYGDSKSMSVTRSVIHDNEAIGSNRGWGGGVYADNRRASAVYITDSTISDNRLSGVSEGYGGGLFISPSHTYYSTAQSVVTRSTVSGNSVYGASVSRGGGIYTAGHLGTNSTVRFDAINSTVSGNRAYGAADSGGGGIWAAAPSQMNLTQVTVTLNEAAYGGGVYRSAGDVRIRNTIVGGNTAGVDGTDVYGTFHTDSVYNVIGIIDGSSGLDSGTTQFGTTAVPLSPGLGTLADNGGETRTHALLSTSPAINAGDNALAKDETGSGLLTDQRGGMNLRIMDGTVDIGAYEGWADTYFALTGPTGATINAAWDTPITWTGNVPTSSKITLYLDLDSSGGLTAGDEYIIQNQPYVAQGGQHLWESVKVPDGDYVIGAVVTDPVSAAFWEDLTGEFALVHSGVAMLYVVDTWLDVVAVDGLLSLREAITAANTNAAVNEALPGDPVEMDAIQFHPDLVGKTITLISPLTITNHVSIEGIGEGDYRVTIDANGTGVVFSVDPGVNAIISDLRLTGGLNPGAAGGAIANAGTLTLEDLEVFSNSAMHGGGVFNDGGDITAARVWIHNNTTTHATALGGGIASEWGRLEVLDSTISGNTACYGGGISGGWYGQVVVSNSTISGNVVTGTNASGGGLYNYNLGEMTLINTTVTSNTATGASATGGGVTSAGGAFTIVNSIVAANTAPTGRDANGAFDPVPGSDYNLIGVIEGSTGLDGPNAIYGTLATPQSPGLDVLDDNGGPTPTHAILTGSLAINEGDDAAALDPTGAALVYDQRGLGYDRILNGAVDMGAFEYNASPGDNLAPVIGGLTLSVDPVTVGNSITLTATGVSDDHGVTAVTFYRDANGDGIGQGGEQLGTDISSAGGWNWTGVVTWSPGQADYLAQVTDDGWPMGVLTSDFAAATGTVIAVTPPDIVVGTHDLLAGATGQEIEIYVTGLDMVTGFNLFAQIGDGQGGAGEPIFESVDFTGGIWDAYANTVVGGVVPAAQQLAEASVVFDNTGDEVLADGLLVTLMVDTTGYTTGQTFDLKLRIDAVGLDSEFILYGGHILSPTVTQGQIDLYEASVVGRHIFYNNSAFDGNDPVANASDDNAIASNKAALLPGMTASFANYTSYSRGIVGVMVDMLGLSNPGGLLAGDFTFAAGKDADPGAWPAAPDPTVSVRVGAGAGGSDRVTLLWADGAIRNEWLQVTVLPTANTGLADSDTFCFGNAVGETGNTGINTFVDGTDFAGVRDHPRNFMNPAPVTFDYDMNRDTFVDGTDLAIVRDNGTNFLTALKLISLPGPSPEPGAPVAAQAAAPKAPGDSSVLTTEMLSVTNTTVRQSAGLSGEFGLTFPEILGIEAGGTPESTGSKPLFDALLGPSQIDMPTAARSDLSVSESQLFEKLDTDDVLAVDLLAEFDAEVLPAI